MVVSGYKKASRLERPWGSCAARPRSLPALRKELIHCANASTVPGIGEGGGRRARARRRARVGARGALRDAAPRLLRADAARARAALPPRGPGRARRLRHEGVRERGAAAPARGG